MFLIRITPTVPKTEVVEQRKPQIPPRPVMTPDAVQDCYTSLHTSQNAFYKYQEECTKWEETYGEKVIQKTETAHEKIQRYQQKVNRQNIGQTYRRRDKGAR